MLRGGNLQYHSSESKEDAKAPRGEVPLSAETKLSGDGACNFQVVSPDRTIELHAESEEQMMEWLRCLRAVVGASRAKQTQV